MDGGIPPNPFQLFVPLVTAALVIFWGTLTIGAVSLFLDWWKDRKK